MIVCISSITGRAALLKRTIESLYNQADHICVVLNNYEETPEFLKDDKITYVHKKNKYGDAYKFYWVNKFQEPMLFCDDDIIYPEGYAEKMLRGLKKYGGIVTIQGRNFDEFPIHSYYHRASERVFCHYVQDVDVKVQFGGTGVMCFDTSVIYPSMDTFKKKNMADIWIGLWCMKVGIEITALSHPEGYVEPQECTGIWHEKHNKDWEQVKIINEFIETL